MEKVKQTKATSADCEELFSPPRVAVPDAEGESEQAVGVSEHTGLLVTSHYIGHGFV